MATQEIGIGLDCCVKNTRYNDTLLVQTTDFFFPLIDDPYLMGKIACANVLSDLYALGVTYCDNMLMLLGASTDMTEQEIKTVIPLMMKGFSDTANEAGCSVNGGQSVKNPWLLMGGVATSVVKKEEIVPYDGAQAGDVLVLTKPLGTQIVVNAYQWYDQKSPRWENLKEIISPEQVVELYLTAGLQMSKLNLQSAREMHNYEAHACTDVTGFGILGHAENLASFQQNNVDFVIHTLPLIHHTKEIFENCGINFKLLEGYSSETSGGLLIAMPSNNADDFCTKLKTLNNGQESAWIVGDVVSNGTKSAYLSSNMKFLSVNALY